MTPLEAVLIAAALPYAERLANTGLKHLKERRGALIKAEADKREAGQAS